MDSLLKDILATCQITGEFKLRSGKTASTYFDKYRFEAQPTLLRAIAKKIKEELLDPKAECLAGLELGGIPVATALSLESNLPFACVRKEAKSYGTCQAIEGLDISGKKVCVVEDVVTTGGQALESIEVLEDAGANIIQVICVLDRSLENENKILNAGYSFTPLWKVSPQ